MNGLENPTITQNQFIFGFKVLILSVIKFVNRTNIAINYKKVFAVFYGAHFS